MVMIKFRLVVWIVKFSLSLQMAKNAITTHGYLCSNPLI
jgi:hypothetical protein